jgi:hypothetical protein
MKMVCKISFCFLLVSGLMFADTQPASSKPKSKTAKTTKAKAAEKKSASKPEAEYEGMPPALAKHLERLHRAMPGHPFVPKFAGGDQDQHANRATTPGEGPIGGFEAYRAASRTYPADEIAPQIVANARATFQGIANADAKNGDPNAAGHKWSFYAPLLDATQPGVTAFSGATNSTASRVTAMLVAPDCSATRCRVWVGVSGGAVWRTDNALAPDPDWKQLHPMDLDQASVGTLALDPTDPTASTIYLGTGEGNRCSSGCEAGVGVYKSTDNGEHWSKLADGCVDNATYLCVNSAADAFLGRGINSIVVDPRNANHIFVGSALGVRGTVTCDRQRRHGTPRAGRQRGGAI